MISRPDCDICRKFPASIIRQHAFDRRKPTQVLCRFCAADSAMPKSEYQIDFEIHDGPPLFVYRTCTQCGKVVDVNGDFTLQGGFAFCPACVEQNTTITTSGTLCRPNEHS